MDQQLKRRLVVTLGGLLMSTLLFMFGITISHNNIIVDSIYYGISLLLLITTLLSCIKTYKQYKKILFVFLIIVDIAFILLTSTYMINNHF
ncbi:hypothetical protein [Kandleria sp.]|uniref:hypothetical protein n=1 Tax=Kandleria sp. TaxID=2774291 RepID=UPI001B581EA1|nr:hypothetical protein [Kandleria sp.]MBP3275728.1 hypothetical protein [Kandleria sp.]